MSSMKKYPLYSHVTFKKKNLKSKSLWKKQISVSYMLQYIRRVEMNTDFTNICMY